MTNPVWLSAYDEGVPIHIDYDDSTIYDKFVDVSCQHPKKSALIFYGRKITYKELSKEVVKLAVVLRCMGVLKGDRVALCLPNTPHFVIAYLAAFSLGAIVVPINPLNHPQEIKRTLNHSESKVVITLTKFHRSIDEVYSELTSVRSVIVGNVKDYLPFAKKIAFKFLREKQGGYYVEKLPRNFFSWRRLLASWPMIKLPDKQVLLAAGDTAVIQYTGGVTGNPKGVELTHFNLMANFQQNVNWLVGFKEGREVIGGILPFFHIYGLTTVLNASLLTGSTLVLLPKPDMAEVVEAVANYKITVLPGVPLLYLRIIKEVRPSRKKFKSLKVCISGGSSLDGDVQTGFEELSGVRIIEGYGLSEASPVTHINPLGRSKLGSIGVPVPDTRAKIVDENRFGFELPPGRENIGHLIVKGPQVMRGYWRDARATAQVKNNGWLDTGDLGYQDDEGYFYVVDRAKDMIVLGDSGRKIYPTEVEEVIRQHPAVSDAVVFRGKGEYGQEVPVAQVILNCRSSASLSDIDKILEDIASFCRREISNYKVPRKFEAVKHIPRNFIGKPMRRLLN